MSIRAILLAGIPSTGPFGIKMTPDIDTLLRVVLEQKKTVSLPLSRVIQGKRNHLDQIEFRPNPEGLEIFACFKKIPNMVQQIPIGEWISLGVVRNPEKILEIDGVLQTKFFKEVVEKAQRLEPNEWNTPTQEMEFAEFLKDSGAGFIPESC